jgi:hypothetical protein
MIIYALIVSFVLWLIEPQSLSLSMSCWTTPCTVTLTMPLP